MARAPRPLIMAGAFCLMDPRGLELLTSCLPSAFTLSETVVGLGHQRSDCRSQTGSVGSSCGQDWWSGLTTASKNAVKRTLTVNSVDLLVGSSSIIRSCTKMRSMPTFTL